MRVAIIYMRERELGVLCGSDEREKRSVDWTTTECCCG